MDWNDLENLEMDDEVAQWAQDWSLYVARITTLLQAGEAQIFNAIVNGDEALLYFGPFVSGNLTATVKFYSLDYELLGYLMWRWDRAEPEYFDMTEGARVLPFTALQPAEPAHPTAAHAIVALDFTLRMEALQNAYADQRQAWKEQNMPESYWLHGVHMEKNGDLSLTVYGETGEELVEYFYPRTREKDEVQISRSPAFYKLGLS